jgi:hypothetical protein
MKIFQPIVSGSFTTSGSVFLKGLTSAAQSNVVLIDTASGQLYTTASSALGGGGGGAAFPFTGSAQITGSLVVTGSTTSTQGFIKPGAGSQYLLADGTTTAGGGSAFPYTGSASITGSLILVGPAQITGSLTQGAAGNTASGPRSHAEGENTTASGTGSHAEGSNTIASGNNSHAEGGSTISSGTWSHAEGFNTIASGVSSHAEGNETKASGSFSHAEGYFTVASGENSHAEGKDTLSSGQYSHAEGTGTRALGKTSHAEGIGFTIDTDIFVEIGTPNNYILTDYFSGNPEAGSNTTTLRLYEDQTGGGTPPYTLNYLYIGSDTYSFEVNNKYYTTIPVVTSAVYDINTGYTTFTFDPPLQSQYYFVEGTGLIASGLGSHAEGDNTKAQGTGSHAEGSNTVAQGNYQHVQGQYNISSSAQGAFIHGNGTSDANRSNLIFASGSQVQITGSLNVSGSITGSLFGTSSYATNALTASYVIGGGGGGSTFPYTGTAVITGSLVVTSTLQLDGSLTDFATVNSTIVGSNNLYTQATGSHTSTFVKYTVSKGTNSRAGEFITNWNGTTVTYFDNSTTDIGNTSDIVFSSAIVSSQIQVNATTATSGWKIKTLATFI